MFLKKIEGFCFVYCGLLAVPRGLQGRRVMRIRIYEPIVETMVATKWKLPTKSHRRLLWMIPIAVAFP